MDPRFTREGRAKQALRKAHMDNMPRGVIQKLEAELAAEERKNPGSFSSVRHFDFYQAEVGRGLR